MTVPTTPTTPIDDETMAALLAIQRKLEQLGRARAAYDRADEAMPGIFKSGERTYVLVDAQAFDELGEVLDGQGDDEVSRAGQLDQPERVRSEGGDSRPDTLTDPREDKRRILRLAADHLGSTGPIDQLEATTRLLMWSTAVALTPNDVIDLLRPFPAVVDEPEPGPVPAHQGWPIGGRSIGWRPGAD